MALFAFMSIPVLGQTTATAPYVPPRTPDGQPNLEGTWQVLNGAHFDLEGATPTLGVPAGHGWVDGGAGSIPYQPAALARKKENFAKRAELDPESKCLIGGIPRMTYMPYPFQIVQQADKVTFLYTYRRFLRRVHMNGNPHPEGPIDFWLGDSRGRWEGNTLVVDVIHFNDKTWFDRAGNFHSEELHVVERYTPTTPDHMLYEATIEDPKVFTRPWKISMPLYRLQGREAELTEYRCDAYLLDQEWDNPNSTYFQER
jgi:hypothetical protein